MKCVHADWNMFTLNHQVRVQALVDTRFDAELLHIMEPFYRPSTLVVSPLNPAARWDAVVNSVRRLLVLLRDGSVLEPWKVNKGERAKLTRYLRLAKKDPLLLPKGVEFYELLVTVTNWHYMITVGVPAVEVEIHPLYSVYEAARLIDSELLGTCTEVSNWLEKHGLEDHLDAQDVEELLDIERCSECEWWVETGELVNAAGDVVPCESCRGRGKEEDE